MRLITALLPFMIIADTFAQNLSKGITYSAEVCSSFSDGAYAPFWFSANKYGLSSVESNSGYMRFSLERSFENDSSRTVGLAYGVDLACQVNNTSAFSVHQLYAGLEYKKLRLTLGARRQPLEMKNEELSMGDMTYGINSRPIPQIRVELKEWAVPYTNGWLGVNGHLSYGWFTDSHWQRDFTSTSGSVHSENSKFHSKAAYITIGKPSVFPLSFKAGVHFCCQFGGESWNMGRRLDDTSSFSGDYADMDDGLSGYWHAFFPGGRDATDGDYDNAEGNHLGSYQASLTYSAKDVTLKLYAEHFFEDHSQMFLQYDWKDFLLGVECEIPHGTLVHNILYEYLGTYDQTGSVYHDRTSNLPIQISGADDYYNHSIYGAWQHWGMSIGNPLLLSPIYNANGALRCYYNRVGAHHFALSGSPSSSWSYRLMFTHLRTLGTYNKPSYNPVYGNYFYAELTCSPSLFRGWRFTTAVGTNGGELIGGSKGITLSVSKSGWLTSRY